MATKNSHPHRIVIVGCGFGGTYTYRYLHRTYHKNSAVQFILVNPRNYFLFTPLLHEVATGGISPKNIVEPIRESLGCCLHDFYLADALRVDTANKTLETTLGTISYDSLVLAQGAETNYFKTPGAQKYSFALKSLEDAVRLKNHVIHIFEQASKLGNAKVVEKMLHVVIIGGGPTGVELAAEMSDFYYGTLATLYPQSRCALQIRISLLQKAPELLPQFPKALRAKALALLKKKKIEVRVGVSVISITPDAVVLDSGERLPSVTPIWVAGVKPKEIEFDRKVQTDAAHRLLVDEYLHLKGSKDIFVLGDSASVTLPGESVPLPGLAQVATKQAYTVARNITALIRNKQEKVFMYRSAGVLISLGEWVAAGEIQGISFFGKLAWWFWRTIYLFKILSFQKKVRVALDWTFDLFLRRDISEL